MDTGSISGGNGYLLGHRKGLREPLAKDMGLMDQEGKRTSHKGLVLPHMSRPKEEKERGKGKESVD